VLAPIEAHQYPGHYSVVHWNPDDLVFNFALVCGRNLTTTKNILQTWTIPVDGDVTDLPPDEVYSDEGRRNRSGIAWMMRKGLGFHRKEWLDVELHNRIPNFNYSSSKTSVTELPRWLPDPLPLLKYEYFVTYDPLTYWSVYAAELGAVSVVHPVENQTKSQWVLETVAGSYLRHMEEVTAGDSPLEEAETTTMNIPGIAYGVDAEEIEYARRTMHRMRPFMEEVKKWGEDVTVPRMARDVYRYSRYGERVHFEGAMLAKDAYRGLVPSACRPNCPPVMLKLSG